MDWLIFGDTIFNGNVGRCFTGDYPTFLQSIKTILELPADTLIYAGHDYAEEYIAFTRNLDPDTPYLDSYLKQSAYPLGLLFTLCYRLMHHSFVVCP